MIQEKLKCFLVVLGWLLAAAPAGAARPMVTDDARVVDPRSCQLEAWWRGQRGGSEYWLLPGCNPARALELSAGGVVATEAGGGLSDQLLQAKYLLRPLPGDGWGLAAAIGTVRHPATDPGGNLLGDVYVNLPLSRAWRQEARVLHVNVGALQVRADGSRHATWGLGTEWRQGERDQLIAELYGQTGGERYGQIGLRHWLQPGRVQLDVTWGGQPGQRGDDQWLSIGLRLLSPAFLP